MLTEDITLLTNFFSDNHNSINQPSLEGDILVNPEDIKREIVTYYDTETEEWRPQCNLRVCHGITR